MLSDIGAEDDNYDNTYHVFYHIDRPEIDSSSIIDGVTICDGGSFSIARANSDKGGGMYNGYCSPTVRNCTFANNRASYGGGIYNSCAVTHIENCVISNNTSGKSGGGLFHYSKEEVSGIYADTKIIHCTIAGNSGNEGSQISVANDDYNTLSVCNSIIWDSGTGIIQYYNPYDMSPEDYPYFVSMDFCCISGGFNGENGLNVNLSYNNTGEAGSPYFADPAGNDYSILSESACIDMGYYKYKTDKDVLGNTRPKGFAYDSGAYEFVSGDPVATSPVLNTLSADSITASTAVCHSQIVSNGGTSIVNRGFKLSTTHNFDPETTGTLYVTKEEYFTDSFSRFISGLNLSATYYFRPYAENRMGYSFGDESSFSTGTVQADINGVVYIEMCGIGDGSSWTDALNGNDIQAAIDHNGVTQLWIKSGTFKPNSWRNGGSGEREKHFALKNGVGVYGGFNGTETSLSQRNYISNPTILSGDLGIPDYPDDNCLNIVKNNNSVLEYLDSTAVLDGFTITKGYDNVLNDYVSGGAAVSNKNAAPKICNCIFEDNYSINDGGAVYNRNSVTAYSGRTINYINCIFRNNITDAFGAALYNRSYCNLNIENCIFRNNYSSYYCGALLTDGNAEIVNCLFENNYAENTGSAIAFNTATFDAPINIINTTVVNNSAGCQDGGICTFLTTNTTYLTNCVLYHNGTGLYIGCEYDIPQIDNCAIEGGIDFEYTGSDNIVLSSNNTGDPDSPYFSDPDRDHWWIQEASPLRNAGIWTDDVPLYDIMGNARDGVPDIGCYEYDPTSIDDDESNIPQTTRLFQNYPNPFNPSTNIRFTLAKENEVELTVYNVKGQLVERLVNEKLKAGAYSITFKADYLNSGVYYYQLKTDGILRSIKRMIYLK